MIEHLSIEQVLHLHALQIGRYGGAARVRDSGGLEAALVRPAMTFAGEDLYPDVPAKAAALMHSLVLNHPFVDGNKRGRPRSHRVHRRQRPHVCVHARRARRD